MSDTIDLNDPSLATKQQTPQEFVQSKYSTPGQQALTVAEGVGQGLGGPLATGAEAALSHIGVPNLTPQDQARRAQANPIERYGTEGATFAGSSLLGVGEARVALEAGNLASKGIEGANVASRIAAQGIKTGAEIAALQTGSEISKFINQDPNQTVGSAAINVGLAGLLGGAAGSGLGAVSELWKSGADKTTALINDAKERVAARQSLESGENQDWSNFDFTNGSNDPLTAAEKPTKDTLGHKIGDYLFEKGQGLAGDLGSRIGEAAGAGLGILAGHPLVGAYLGRKTLAPIIETIAKPMLEGVTNPEGLKSAVDYITNAVKGNELLNNAVSGVIKSSEILPKHLIPDQSSRDKLQKHIDALQSPDDIINSGGQLGHYMPDHLTAATTLISQAKSLLDSQKPSTQAPSPWVGTTPPTPLQQAKYDRLLDIAQQPLMVLKYAKDGTLTNKDVATLNAIYPGLSKAISDKLGSKLVEAKSSGVQVPYHIRTATSKLSGANLDASQSPYSMQSIIQSAGPQQQSNKTSGGKTLPKGHTTAAQLKAIDQTNKLYATRTQAREAAEAAGKA